MVSDGQGSPKIIGNMTIQWIAYDFLYKKQCVYLVLFSSYSEFICQKLPI